MRTKRQQYSSWLINVLLKNPTWRTAASIVYDCYNAGVIPCKPGYSATNVHTALADLVEQGLAEKRKVGPHSLYRTTSIHATL